MTRTPVEPISAEMERLLAVEREIPPVPPALRARVVERARAAFFATRALPRRRQSWLLAAAAVVVFAAASWATIRELGSDAAVNTPAPSSVPNAQRSPNAAEPSQTSAERAPAPPVSPAEPRASKKGVQEIMPRRASSAEARALELDILQRARKAVAGGQFEAALGAIAEHQRRFAGGVLREEREALRVKALAGLGNADEARKAARRFREQFPDSVLSPRLEEATQKAP